MNRRSFLTTLGASLAWSDTEARVSGGTVRTISIIHTTDLHGRILPGKNYDGVGDLGGLARCATLIRRWRRETPHHLLIDVGDLYQGTDVGRRTNGQVMVNLINRLGYDAWVLGNHDFDWGRDILDAAVSKAAMPVLAGNVKFSGRLPGEGGKDGPFARLAPHLLRTVGGFKIGLVGTVTPGLPSWLHPSILREVEVLDPLEPVRRSIRALREAGAQAVVVAGHMGFKAPGFCRDDFANRIADITKSCDGIDLFIGAHTHRDVPTDAINRVPYTQANYYGIHLGRVDLTFHVESGALLERRLFTVLMDERFEPDPAVLAWAGDDLESSNRELDRPIGTLGAPLAARSAPGQPGDHQKLIARALREALARKNVSIDAVMHGSFSDRDIPAGPKTVRDVWEFMPFENFIVTAEVTPAELEAVMNEAFASDQAGRNLMGLTVRVVQDGGRPRVTGITDTDGRPLDPARRYRIAFNSYDAQSGGQRLPRLRQIVEAPDSAARFHEIETRDAVVEYFLNHRENPDRSF